MRHIDVSQDPRYNHWVLSAADGDAECTMPPRRIPDWVLPPGETQTMFQAGHGTAPDLMYARGAPNSPSPDPTSFDKKRCNLIIVEFCLCTDLDCDIKIEKNTEKYSPFIAALRRPWERVEFIAFPIGHVGTTLTKTLDHLTAAFSTVRHNVERSRDNRGAASPAKDHNAMTHDYNMFKSLQDSLTDLAQSRLLGIIRNKKRLVDALPGGDNHHRAHSDASPTRTRAAQ